MWRAIENRDAMYDGLFVYGVLSTKIYCSPSCPSRHPRMNQAVFFSHPVIAERASFRACMRCRPEVRGEERGQLSRHSSERRVAEACRFIDANRESKLSLALVASHVGMSPFHLQRVFKKTLGVSPREYAEASKLERAKLLMRSGESVRKSIYGTGHSSTSWLYSNPFTRLGMRPAEYRNGGSGMSVYYSMIDCPLGRLLVAGTERGICAISLGDSDVDLEVHLRNEYPRAEIKKDEKSISLWVARILEYLTNNDQVIRLSDLPLDIKATSFQIRVWKALQSIPYGTTLSYSEVASRISEPKATRAVANACAANPVPLVVPCHRVIRNDGSLGGYRLGLERKKILLEKERAAASKEAIVNTKS